MPAAICAPRVEELSARRAELEAHSKRLSEVLLDAIPRVPTREEVAALRAEVADVIAQGSPALKKELFDELLSDVQIRPGQQAYPRFKVPDVDHPGPFVARALNRTKSRPEYQIVEVTRLEAPSGPLRPLQCLGLSKHRLRMPRARASTPTSKPETSREHPVWAPLSACPPCIGSVGRS